MNLRRVTSILLLGIILFGQLGTVFLPVNAAESETTGILETSEPVPENTKEPLQGLQAEEERDPSQDLSIEGGSHSLDAKAPVLGNQQLVKNASSAILYEAGTDTLMYSWNADDPVYPASLVKIMTALLVIENGNLKEDVIVSQKAIDSVTKGAVSAHLQAGEIISVENLLYCMMVDSANDAAAVLAEHISNSQADFVSLMNRRAAELGCKGTHFVNPHGLHHESQVTTSRDVCRILREAMRHEIFRTIFGTVRCTIPATNLSEERNLETGNFLMNPNSMEIYFDSRVTGGRTGVTENGTRCIAATAEKNEMFLISVVMGAASEYEEDGTKVKSFGGFPETTQLLDQCFDAYKPARIVFPNQSFKQYPVPNGTSDVVVYPRVSVSTILSKDDNIYDLSYRFQEVDGALNAPIEKDQLISQVEIWNDGICIGQAELFAMNRVEVKETVPPIPIQEDNTDLIYAVWIVLGILGFLLFLIIIRNFLKRKKRMTHRKRVSRNRRRSR